MTLTDRHHDSGRIVLTDLVKEFSGRDGATRAVDGIHLETQPGEFVTLLGPSGCGKTTTLRMIAGFTEPTAGQILVDGKNVSTIPPYRRNIGIFFQNYALFPHMTVFENVAFGLKLQKLPKNEIRERVEHMLALVKLTGMDKRYPRQLSGGQQQRVALARVLYQQPDLLLADEPVSAMDPALSELTVALLNEEAGHRQQAEIAGNVTPGPFGVLVYRVGILKGCMGCGLHGRIIPYRPSAF